MVSVSWLLRRSGCRPGICAVCCRQPCFRKICSFWCFLLVPIRLQAWNDSSDYRGGLRADQKPGLVRSRISVKSLSAWWDFHTKRTAAGFLLGKFLPQFFFAFLFRQNPSASFLFWRTVPFLQIGKCIVLMVSEFFFISVPVQRFLHETCGRRRSARSTSSGCRKWWNRSAT